MTENSSKATPQQFRVSRSDLPLACPNELTGAGVAHPRVFLAFDEEGRAVCPYCGTEYVIKD